MNDIVCEKTSCYWESVKVNNECCNCIHNENAKEKKRDCYIDDLNKVNELYEYLTGGKMPDGVTCKMPKLSNSVAFDVIWFLQEVTCCLPDNIEQCRECECLFNSDYGGFRLDDQYKHKINGRTIGKKYWGNYCDDCVPDIDFELK